MYGLSRALLAALALLAAGCTAAERPVRPSQAAATAGDPGSVAAAPPVGTNAAATGDDAWQQRWDAVLAGARQEGKVVMAVPAEVADEYRAMLGSVGARYGFAVEARAINASEVTQVVMRECSMGRQTLDVLQGGLSEAFDVYPQGCLAPLKPQLILPEVTDPQNWRDGTLKFDDPEGAYMLQLGEAVYGPVAYNTERVQPEQISTSRDLLKPEFKGKITSYDPRRAGTGRGLSTYFLTTLGPDYVRQLYQGQEVASIADHRQLAESIARGAYWVGLAHVERGVEPLRREGLPIGIRELEDAPGYVTGGSTVVKIVNNAPHPNAATVLVNWLASRDGQKAMMEVLGQPSRRVDVAVPDSVAPYRLPKPGVDYADGYDFDFYTKTRPQAEQAVLEILSR
jgi:iron(III) transport system substrate-binding protein